MEGGIRVDGKLYKKSKYKIYPGKLLYKSPKLAIVASNRGIIYLNPQDVVPASKINSIMTASKRTKVAGPTKRALIGKDGTRKLVDDTSKPRKRNRASPGL